MHHLNSFGRCSLAALGMALLGVSCCTTHRDSEINLFNGRDLKGWAWIAQDGTTPIEQVWTVKDGILSCTGKPLGAIYRGPEVTNFRYVVEYRWAPGTTPGNSGIFSRISGELKPIPPAIEIQLMHHSAGDVLGLQGHQVAANQPRFFEIKKNELAGDIAGVKKVIDAEQPPGEWNRVEITANGSHYTVRMNGQLVNDVEGVQVVQGPVGLQSEGGAIQFRKATLYPLD